MKVVKSFKASIHVGLRVHYTDEIQPAEKAKAICQSFVDERGECVSFTPTEYIYTKGNEPGLIIEFISYPRFPRTNFEILKRAFDLGEILMRELQQYRITIVTPESTFMLESDKENLIDNSLLSEDETEQPRQRPLNPDKKRPPSD